MVSLIEANQNRLNFFDYAIQKFYERKPSQIVYVLTNPVMPGIIKDRQDNAVEVSERIEQLYSTGVPVRGYSIALLPVR